MEMVTFNPSKKCSLWPPEIKKEETKTTVYDPMAGDWRASLSKQLPSFMTPCGDVKVGDSVIAECETNVFALVRSIAPNPDGDVYIRIKRYYTPEQTVGGKQPFYGNKELLLTNHLEALRPIQIFKKIHVHSFVGYTKLKTVGDDDYFFRFEYEIGSGWLSPSVIEVFCKCKMPFNPDMFSLMCVACKERYHPACINMPLDEAKLLTDNFTCSDCLAPDNQDPAPDNQEPEPDNQDPAPASSSATTVDPLMVAHKRAKR